MNKEIIEYKCTECGCCHDVPYVQHEDQTLFHECGCGAPMIPVDQLWKTKFEQRFREILGSLDVDTGKIEKRIELNWYRVSAYDFNQSPRVIADSMLKHYCS